MSIFTSDIRERKPKKTRFNLSHSKLLTSEFYKLTPVLCQEVLPGDTFNIRTAMNMKMAPFVLPVMHEMTAYLHYFFVPNRILWKYWPDYIVGMDHKKQASGISISGPNMGFTNPPPNMHVGLIPEDLPGQNIELDAIYGPGSLLDNLGFDIDFISWSDHGFRTSTPININVLPLLAYQKIYDEFYRDTDKDEANPSLEYWYDLLTNNYSIGPSTADDIANAKLDPSGLYGRAWNILQTRYKAYPKDYLTTANNRPNFGAEVQQTSPFTIRQFRQNAQMQELLEKQMRTGYRYTEFLKAFFNANNRDDSLQRPQYLGGGKQPIIASEVVQTSWGEPGVSASPSPLGSRASVGHSFSANSATNYHATEHGYLMAIMYIAPKTMYMNGTDRTFLRGQIPSSEGGQGRFDWYLPEFQNIGEQKIYNLEVGSAGWHTEADSPMEQPWGTFGYNTRDAYYKTPSRSNIHGQFRTTLQAMHAARPFMGEFEVQDMAHTPKHYTKPFAKPLDSNFIRYSPYDLLETYPNFANRVFAVENNGFAYQDNFWIECAHAISARRPMVAVAKPTLGYHNI